MEIRKFYYYAAALALSLAVSCSGGENNAGNERVEDEDHDRKEGEVELTQAQMNTVGITLGQISEMELGGVVHATGTLAVDPQDAAEVAPLLAGIAKRISVVEGQAVSKGQVVAYIENTDIVALQQELLTVSQEALFAAQEYERQQALAKQGAGVGKNLSKAESDYEIVNARLAGVRRKLAQIGIDSDRVLAENIVTQIPVLSPISGIVSKIFVSTGSYADMQTPLMSIIDNNAVYCKLNIFEQDVDRVNAGMTAEIQAVGQPRIRIKGVVKEVTRSIDPEAKTLSVRVVLDDVPAGAVPGMSVKASINSGTESVDALPEDAIISSAGRYYIFVLDHEAEESGERVFHFKRVEVMPGVSDLGYTQVSFLSPGDEHATVVTSGAFYLGSMSSDHGEHTH